MNCNFNLFIDRLKKLNRDEKEILAKNIYSKMHEIHKIKDYDINWEEVYQEEVNLTLYKNGLIRSPKNKQLILKEYILTDFIKENFYYVKDRSVSKVIDDNSILRIEILDDLEVNIVESDRYTDKILDYICLNVIAYFDKEFANIFVNNMTLKSNMKFFKVLSLYTAKYCLDLLVLISNSNNEDDCQSMAEVVDFIFESYDDFTRYMPKWLEN